VAVEESRRRDGVGIAIAFSLVLHAVLVVYAIKTYKPVASEKIVTPMVHYVELMRQTPQTFTEAPGPKVRSAPIDAPFSDANRRASMPEPTGDQPTKRPGDGGPLWTPPASAPRHASGPAAQRPQQAVQQQASQQHANADATQQPAEGAAPSPNASSSLSYRQPVAQANAGAVDWHSAIREVGKIASIGTDEDQLNRARGGGGEKGYAESGPISFETQWYDWGEYAQSMVRRIRVNWDANMPDLIRTGMKGHLTIRFTIHRDGRITDVTILDASEHPPYNFAAKKAIELSSPLNPLPKDFPNDTERVTAMFFYNEQPPAR